MKIQILKESIKRFFKIINGTFGFSVRKELSIYQKFLWIKKTQGTNNAEFCRRHRIMTT